MKQFFLLALVFTLLSSPVMALTQSASFVGDLSIVDNMPGYELYNVTTPYLWVGNNGSDFGNQSFISILRFDMSPIMEKQNQGYGIESLSFFSYNNYNQPGFDEIYVSVGNNDHVPLPIMTWNNSSTAYGDIVGSTIVGDSDLNTHVEWLLDIDPLEWAVDNLLTLFLYTDNAPGSLHDFQRRIGYNYNGSYLTAEMAPVPEPATLVLLSAGLLGLTFYRKKIAVKAQ